MVLEAGDTGWHKIQSVFSVVRMWGGGVPLAYAVQGAVTREEHPAADGHHERGGDQSRIVIGARSAVRLR